MPIPYDVLEPGFNYRLDEIRAAIGSVQLQRLEAENAARRRLAALYRERLDGVEGITVAFPVHDDRVVSSQHLAGVLLPERATRRDIQAALAKEGIQTSVHYSPIHTFTHYAALTQQRHLPETEAIQERLLTLRLFGHMTEEQLEFVADRVVAAI
jgi:dTDP-4-amino-4,6-dideoxygalactose transaminase